MANVTVQGLRGFSTGIMFKSCSMGGRALLNLGQEKWEIQIGLGLTNVDNGDAGMHGHQLTLASNPLL